MARSKTRQQQRKGRASSPSQLRQKAVAAIERGAYSSARETAKALCKQEDTPAHRRLLAETTVGRAAQLRQAGQTTEAVNMLRTVVDDTAEMQDLLAPCIRELILVGDWRTADRLTAQVTDASVRRHLEALRADAAVLHGDPGEVSLPEALQSTTKCVLQALADWEQGHDAAANEAIADIPPESPLHEWKLLLQGLTAYYAGEPTALALWQSLHPERVPAAIAAPFRAQIDPMFLANHPHKAAFTEFSRHVYDAPWLNAMENVQRALAQSDLAAALEHAWQAKTTIAAEHQELLDRVAHTLYWQVVRLGQEDDIDMYAETFDAPRDDPSLHRLHALVNERDEDYAAAQQAWAAYERDLAKHDIIRPKADLELARSFVWLRMGELADHSAPTLPSGLSLPFDHDERCAFDAAKCFRQSVKLAPQHVQAHESLIDLLHRAGKQKQVVRAAGQLIKYVPEHEGALVALADDACRRDRWDEAVTLQTRALQTRPHDKELRVRLDAYELGLARQRAQRGKFDAARAILTAHLERKDETNRRDVLCRLAAVERKAGEQQYGEALFEQACEVGASRLVAVFKMLIESIRMPLDTTWIQSLDREFQRGLKAKIDAPSAVEMLQVLAAFASFGAHYDGLEAHQDLIMQYLKRSRQITFSEEDLLCICASLRLLPPTPLLLDFAKRGIQAYPQQPMFPITMASYYFTLPPEECPLQEIDTALHAAQDIVQGNPAHAHMAQQIETMLSVVHTAIEMRRFSSLGRLFNVDDDDDEFDDDPFGPDGPDLFDVLSNLFGSPLDEDDLDEFTRRRSKGGKKKRRGR